MSEVNAGTVADIARAGGTKDQLDRSLLTGAKCAKLPNQHRALHDRGGIGSDELGVGGQGILHFGVMSARLRLVADRDAVNEIVTGTGLSGDAHFQ